MNEITLTSYSLRGLSWLPMLAVVCIVGCSTMFPFRYAPNPVLAPGISTGELLLEAEPFPEGWIVFPCEPYCDRRERNGDSGRSFGIVGVPGHVIQHVMYFDSEEAAKIKLERYKEANLPDAPITDTVQIPNTAFLPPSEITYRSPFADEQYLGCGVDVVPGCEAGLRYDNYFVYFYFDLRSSYYFDYLEVDEAEKMPGHEGGLTLAQVETILQAMDERYADLFEVESPSKDGD